MDADSQRDNNNEMVGEMTLWECPTRRGVLSYHKFDELDSQHIRLGKNEAVSKGLFGPPIFRKSSDDFKDIPGRGKCPWHSPKPIDICAACIQCDVMLWCQ